MKPVNSAMCIFFLLSKRITIRDQSILSTRAPSRHHAYPLQHLQSNLLLDVTYNPSHTLPFSTVHFPSTFSSPVCTLTPYSPSSHLQTFSLSSQKLPAYLSISISTRLSSPGFRKTFEKPWSSLLGLWMMEVGELGAEMKRRRMVEPGRGPVLVRVRWAVGMGEEVMVRAEEIEKVA
jgi:hypothetical protein